MYFQHTAGMQVICILTVCLTYRVKYIFYVCHKYGRDTDKLSAGYISNIQVKNTYYVYFYAVCLAYSDQSPK